MKTNRRRRIWRGVMLAIGGVLMLLAVGEVYRRTAENRPTEFRPDPEVYTVKGIDVSAHQGEVDFERVAADGVDFVILKATEGTDFKDSRFIDNYREARRAGLKVGAYHFFRFDTDGRMQAINLLHSVRNRRLDFPVIIDVEEWGNPDAIDTAEIIGRLRSLLRHLQINGIEAMIYTNKDGYERFIRDNFAEFPLWIATMTDPEPELGWALWQYSHKGTVDGVEGKVDLNTVNPQSPLLRDVRADRSGAAKP
ncbi:MAG: hypothetical protein K2G64_08030 [Muribaculaceae bacterium]|nr:hypothetical protein [Muribaculaceae bacterium]MDE7393068.1 hypothetical protein [Muribaculaceae bacterium]